jgi:hypothetical protein
VAVVLEEPDFSEFPLRVEELCFWEGVEEVILLD